MVSHQITLRAWSANADLPPVQINQGDILSRTVFITLISGGQAVDLTNSTARVHFSKPDGTVVYLTASIVNAAAGIISVTLDSQCTAVPGLVKSIVQVTGPDGENLFFVGLNFQVAAVNIEDSIVSSNEFTALTNALAVVQDIDNRVPKTTQINGHALTGDIDLTPADVSAIAASEKGVANGVASLDASGKLVQMPSAADVGAPSIPTISTQPFALNNMTGDWTGIATGGMEYVKIGCFVKFWCWFYVSTVGNGGNMMITLPKIPNDYYQFTAYKTQVGTNNSVIPASQFIFANLSKTAICMGFTSSGSGYQIATGAYYCDGSYLTNE
jgi:hypothetical protein